MPPSHSTSLGFFPQLLGDMLGCHGSWWAWLWPSPLAFPGHAQTAFTSPLDTPGSGKISIADFPPNTRRTTSKIHLHSCPGGDGRITGLHGGIHHLGIDRHVHRGGDFYIIKNLKGMFEGIQVEEGRNPPEIAGKMCARPPHPPIIMVPPGNQHAVAADPGAVKLNNDATVFGRPPGPTKEADSDRRQPLPIVGTFHEEILRKIPLSLL